MLTRPGARGRTGHPPTRGAGPACALGTAATLILLAGPFASIGAGQIPRMQVGPTASVQSRGCDRCSDPGTAAFYGAAFRLTLTRLGAMPLGVAAGIEAGRRRQDRERQLGLGLWGAFPLGRGGHWYLSPSVGASWHRLNHPDDAGSLVGAGPWLELELNRRFMVGSTMVLTPFLALGGRWVDSTRYRPPDSFLLLGPEDPPPPLAARAARHHRTVQIRVGAMIGLGPRDAVERHRGSRAPSPGTD